MTNLEEYEMVENIPLTTTEFVDRDSSNHITNLATEDSLTADTPESDSESSIIFDHLEVGQDKDNFTENETFLTILNHYNAKPSSSSTRRIATFIGGLVFALWLGGLIIYSRVKITQSSTWKWQTSLVQLGSENITINPYNVKNSNLSMTAIRRGDLSGNFRWIQWLNKPQYPQSEDSKGGAGFYLARGPESSYLLVNAHSDEKRLFIENIQFAYANNFFYIQEVQLNPQLPIDGSGTVHIVKTDNLNQWRHSKFGLYWLYEPVTNQFTPIQPIEPQEGSEPKSLLKMHFAQFSPDGKTVIFGLDHDLYYLDLNTMKTTRITDTGSPDILNGKPDWVYEEEILSDDKFFWWSPDSEHIIYGQINDTGVMEYEIDYYVKDINNVGLTYDLTPNLRVGDVNQYPVKKSLKYPKPGSKDPHVTMYLYSFKDNKSTAIKYYHEVDSIVYDGAWINNDKFLIKVTDRRSKIMSKQVIDITKNDNLEVYKVDSKDFGGWFDKVSDIVPIKDGYIDKIFINGRCHLAYYKDASTVDPQVLTSSDQWDMLEKAQVVYNEIEEMIYTLSNIKGSMDSHLVGLDLEGNMKFIIGGDQQGNFEFTSDSNGQFISLEYLGPELPWQRIINTGDLHLQDESQDSVNSYLKSVPMISNIKRLQSQVSKYNLPTRRYSTVEINGVNINMIEIFPPNFKPDGKRKYPILVNAYGGPGSQTVTKAYILGFNDVVSAVLDAIVLVIDPRGTNGQGWKFKSYAKNNIGYWEGRDIKTITSEYIKKNKNIIQTDSVAIWGWSYGGFTTLKTLEIDQGEVFKYGMAVAPVTNWLFYNSFYTERYMDLPSENVNYDKMAKISNIKAFNKICRFLIMHGTADDNVHLQNSLWLLDKFNTNGTENYDVHFFPDNNHAINYHNSGVIIYDKLLHWVSDAFEGKFREFY